MNGKKKITPSFQLKYMDFICKNKKKSQFVDLTALQSHL